MSWTLETLLTEFATSPLATVRQAACVWLLALLKHAGNHPDVQVPVVCVCMCVCVCVSVCVSVCERERDRELLLKIFACTHSHTRTS